MRREKRNSTGGNAHQLDRINSIGLIEVGHGREVAGDAAG